MFQPNGSDLSWFSSCDRSVLIDFTAETVRNGGIDYDLLFESRKGQTGSWERCITTKVTLMGSSLPH
jgi:hypothetical protein